MDTLTVTAAGETATAQFDASPPPAVLPLFGSSMQGNGDVTPLEKAAGRLLGLHRTYGNFGIGSDGIAETIAAAKDDTTKGRTPWLSFKPAPGHTWADQAAGVEDAVVRQVAAALKALGKPVWVAIDHEPEGDGVMSDFTKALDHILPIMVAAAPNVVPWMILTGGDAVDPSRPQYSLDTLWPKVAKPNVAFDGYNRYGDANHPANSTGKGWSEMKTKFYDVIAPWAKAHGVEWAIAETGYTDAAFARDPAWLDRAYDDMCAHPVQAGVGLSYFNSGVNSNGSWPLTGGKLDRFASVLKRSR